MGDEAQAFQLCGLGDELDLGEMRVGAGRVTSACLPLPTA